MKRQVQLEGVRKWAGDHLLELQHEPLKVLDGFFGSYGPYILNGCAVSASGDLYDAAPGLVVLAGKDRSGNDAVMVVPFAGATGVPMPLYLTLAWTVRQAEYANGAVQPISYDYYAAASTVEPDAGTAYLLLNGTTPRFIDVLLPDWSKIALTDGTYLNLTAGNSLKLGGRPAADYLLREELGGDGFKVTNISGWTGTLTVDGTPGTNDTPRNVPIPITKDVRADAIYAIFLEWDVDPTNFIYEPQNILFTIRFDSEEPYAMNIISKNNLINHLIYYMGVSSARILNFRHYMGVSQKLKIYSISEILPL